MVLVRESSLGIREDSGGRKKRRGEIRDDIKGRNERTRG